MANIALIFLSISTYSLAYRSRDCFVLLKNVSKMPPAVGRVPLPGGIMTHILTSRLPQLRLVQPGLTDSHRWRKASRLPL